MCSRDNFIYIYTYVVAYSVSASDAHINMHANAMFT